MGGRRETWRTAQSKEGEEERGQLQTKVVGLTKAGESATATSKAPLYIGEIEPAWLWKRDGYGQTD